MPFVHHTMPLVDMKSYVEWIHIPYTRWFPAPVKRRDVVVFNFPDGDTVINKEGYQSEQTLLSGSSRFREWRYQCRAQNYSR